MGGAALNLFNHIRPKVPFPFIRLCIAIVSKQVCRSRCVAKAERVLGRKLSDELLGHIGRRRQIAVYGLEVQHQTSDMRRG